MSERIVAVVRGGDTAALAQALANLRESGEVQGGQGRGVAVLHDHTCPCMDDAPFADCRCREVWLRLEEVA